MPISLHIPNLVKFYPFVLKILSKNEKVKSVMGLNSVTHFRNMTNKNTNLHLVNIKFIYKIWSNSINLSGKWILDEILTAVKGHNSATFFWKIMCNKPNLDVVYVNVIHNLIKNFYHFVLKILNWTKLRWNDRHPKSNMHPFSKRVYNKNQGYPINVISLMSQRLKVAENQLEPLEVSFTIQRLRVSTVVQRHCLWN